MKPISPELSERIQRHVNDFPGEAGAWPARMCREKFNALPLHGDQIFLWAIRPDGVVIRLDHESASLPVSHESDLLTLYAVLQHGAKRYPELQELAPLRPPGVEQCAPCSGTGVTQPALGCTRCRGLGWHIIPRPIDEWLERIVRGDQLSLQVAGRNLLAAKMAGRYVVKDGVEYWSFLTTTPTAAVALHKLRERLVRFEAGKHVIASWRENVTEVDDPFESTEYALVSHQTGVGGSCTVEFTRQPDGEYLLTTTLYNDWDPLGSGPPTVRTERLTEAKARKEIENQIRDHGFPAVVKRE